MHCISARLRRRRRAPLTDGLVGSCVAFELSLKHGPGVATFMHDLRCFLAVRVPASRQLSEVLGDLRACGQGIRVVDPRQLHVTLKFLGATKPEDIAAIARGLEQAVQDMRPTEVQVVGLGAFPNVARPRVVWAGLESTQLVTQLAERCEAVCVPLGYPREERAFHPHVTLARIEGRPPEGFADVWELFAETAFASVGLKSLELMQSEPQRTGPVYSTLATILLPGR